MAWIGLFAALIFLAVDASLRLGEAGIGCPDYPECYARIGQVSTARSQPDPVGSGFLFTNAHIVQFFATAFLFMTMLMLNLAAYRAGQYRYVCLAALALSLLLAWPVVVFGAAMHPAKTVGVLTGSFMLTGLLGWLIFRLDTGAPRYMETRLRHLRPFIMTALVLLVLQTLLGGMTSANFAATACKTFPHCNEQWFPDARIYSALKIGQAYSLDARGYAIGGMERESVHQAHRVVGAIALFFIAAAAVSGMLASYAHRKLGTWMLIVLLAEFSLGVAAVLLKLPAILAVAHSLLAAILLLLLFKMMAISREKWWPG